MSDREIIVTSLRKAERRIRTNRLLNELTFGLSIFLLFPILFKIVDLFSPFRGRTVFFVLAAWFAALIVYLGSRARHKGTLEQAAAEIDTMAGLSDELKSAYWFIRNPKVSDWVEVQIRRAAQRVSNLNIDRLYPRVFPRTSYLAAALIVVLIGLNFAPLSLNHNWLLMQAAPAFTLTDAERNLVEQIQEMLKQANQQNKADLAAQIQEVLKQLEEGQIDAPEALRLLQGIQDQLSEGGMNTEDVGKSLEGIAQAFESSDALKDAAKALRDKDLKDAAAELENAAKNMQDATSEELKDMKDALEDAAKNAAAFKELGDNMKQAVLDLERNDKDAAQESLEKAAQALKDLQQQLEDQKLSQAAGEQLQDLKEMIQQRQQKPGDPQSGEAKPDQANGEERDTEQTSEDPNMTPADSPSGDEASGASHDGPIKESQEATSLEVQLEKQELSGEFEPEKKPTEIEETSKQERSKLDYRNVPSELTPSQRDLLNPEHIPLEYRNLIRDYFEAIKPPSEQK